MFDDDGRLVAYTGRYRDKVIELKTRSVTICTLHACNKTETSMLYNTKNWQEMLIMKTLKKCHCKLEQIKLTFYIHAFDRNNQSKSCNKRL